jgi:lipopolysaccharide/colanic/teichoic acid biosynthesis glycosyltransferase
LLAATLGPLLPLALLDLPLLPIALLAPGLLVAGRASHHAALRAGRRRGLIREATLIVGADPMGVRIGEILDAHPELGLWPRGFVDAAPQPGETPLRILGGIAELPDLVAFHRVSRIIVCSPQTADAELVRVLRGLTADVCLVPRLQELGMRVPVGCMDEVWGIPLVPLRRTGWRSRATKRAFDLVVGLLMLVALAPVMVGLALAAKRGSGTLFRQTRITMSGRKITILKLRTIAGDHDADSAWAVDPNRYLRLGAFLRTTHLDELPQLVNVVKGDMSLVGPRPERPLFAELFADHLTGYRDRLRMPAGMTGWAQVHGLHGDTSIEERARFDNQYIEYWSPWRDVVILLRTLTKVLPVRTGGRR